ncbi:MAG: hypothetical protein ACQEW5_27460 [Bacillota bacterium]
MTITQSNKKQQGYKNDYYRMKTKKWFFKNHFKLCPLLMKFNLKIYSEIFKTARNLVDAAIILSYASVSTSRGKVSIIGRTSVRILKLTASWISFASPVNEPLTVLGPFKKSIADNSNRSPEPATIISSLSEPSPLIREEIALASAL